MAQETILKVSLKDYKKGIDDLRASLLGLDKDSEEYGKIVQEIAERQDNLNDAMNAGKQAVNAVDGSYNALAQTLSNLKKEWKNMEMGTPEWEAMAVRINDINNQLKDADASVGVFTRNVGDYANAFEEAFKQAVGGLSSMPGIIGSIGSTTKQLIPLIQKASTTATAGLKGVKKALVSTGIGALIVAVGLLIAHFDDLRKLFKKNNPAEDAQKAFDALKASIDAANDSLSLEIELMEAEGATTEEVRLKKIELIKAQQAQTLAQLENVRATIKQIEAHSAFRRWITGEKKDLEELKETEKQLFELESSQSKEITKLLNSNTADRIKKKKQAADEEKKKLDEILKKVKDNSKSEIQALTDKYNEELALLKKYGKDSTELTKQYEENLDSIRRKATEGALSRLASYQPLDKLLDDYKKKFGEIIKWQEAVGGEFPPEYMLEAIDVEQKMIDKAQELKLVSSDSAEEFAAAYRAAFYEFEEASKNFTDAQFGWTKAGQEYLETLQAEGSQMQYLNEVTDHAFEKINLFQDELETAQSVIENIKKGNFEPSDLFPDADTALLFWQQLETQIKKAIETSSREWEEASAAVINYKNSLKEIQEETKILEAEFGKNSNWQWFSNTSQFYEIYQSRLDAAIWYRDNLEIIEGETIEAREKRELEAEQAILKIKREYAQKHIEISQALGGHLTSIWGSINDIYESNAKAQGKTDEEVFNQTKGSKIALATVETIQGALAAFMGYQQYPQPYGAILGGIAAAATTAAGMAQIAAIKATRFDSQGNDISNPVAVVNATPRMADYQPDTIQNLTGASETQNLANALQQTPIYVSVTDINNAQAKVTDRNNESSF